MYRRGLTGHWDVWREPSTLIWEDGVKEDANDGCYMTSHGACSQTFERHRRSLGNDWVKAEAQSHL